MNAITVQNEVVGLNFTDVLNKVTSYVKPTIEAAKVGNKELMEKEYTLMIEKLQAVKELVVNEKIYQWQFREYNDNFSNWENTLLYINKFLNMDFQATLLRVLNKIK